MFKKIKLDLTDLLKKKILYLEKVIDRGEVLYRDDTLDFKFKQYPEGTDEKKIFDLYVDKYTIYKQVDFPYKPICNIIPYDVLNLEWPHVHWQIFNGGSLVPPHIDKQRICTINLYTTVNGEKTIVYDKIRNGSYLETENGIITNETFIPEWLNEIASFEAKQWDCYLLNVNTPHSVIDMTEKTRISISFSFYRTPYNILTEIL